MPEMRRYFFTAQIQYGFPYEGRILKKLSVIWKAFREFSFFPLLAPTAHCKPQCQRPECRRINGGFRNDVNNSKPGPNIRRTRFVSVKKISYVYPIALALGCGGICPAYHNTFRHGKTSAFGIDSVRPFGRIAFLIQGSVITRGVRIRSRIGKITSRICVIIFRGKICRIGVSGGGGYSRRRIAPGGKTVIAPFAAVQFRRIISGFYPFVQAAKHISARCPVRIY